MFKYIYTYIHDTRLFNPFSPNGLDSEIVTEICNVRGSFFGGVSRFAAWNRRNLKPVENYGSTKLEIKSLLD